MQRDVIRLVGPGGAGKTTTGAELARRLGLTFVDLDERFAAMHGDISAYLDAHGYAPYATQNVECYLEVIAAEAGPQVMALSSGFMTYAPDVHPDYAHVRREIAASATTLVLLPSLDCETCVAETVRRQLGRVFCRSAEREEQVIRLRFSVYRSLAATKLETMKPISEVVDAAVAQHPLAADGGRCDPEPPRLKRNVGRTTTPTADKPMRESVSAGSVSREFATERLFLRRWRRADRAPFAALNADARVMQYLPKVLLRGESDALVDRIERHFDEHGFGLWAVEIPGVASFAGFVGLSTPRFQAHFTPCVEIGWRLAVAHWGHGYATEAARATLRLGFEQLGREEIVSFTVPENERSRAVMNRIGMVYDPTDDFEVPDVPERLQRHLLYRITRTGPPNQRLQPTPRATMTRRG